MKRVHRFGAIALSIALGAGIMSAPLAARASEEGKRNTAIGLGAAAVGLLLTQRNKLPGIVAAAGAAYAYKQYDDSVRNRHRWESGYGYDYNRYHNNYDYNRNRDHYYQDSYNYNYNNDNYNCPPGSYQDGSYNNGYNGNGDYYSRSARRYHSRTPHRH